MSSQYLAKKPDANGIVHYTDEENLIWRDLYQQQTEIVKNRACAEYLRGLDILNMAQDRIPQLHEMDKALGQATGWSVAPVAALIDFNEFFNLLANRKFPAATFIRTREDFKYIQEPDIFHEYFGHCPMLTEPVYAEFMEAYGKIGQGANHQQQVLLARIYWFTVEFGLIHTKQGLRIYGGGILSSPEETVYALESKEPKRQDFNVVTTLKTDYRIDVKQTDYFILDSYQQLYDLVQQDLLKLVDDIRNQVHFPSPRFPC